MSANVFLIRCALGWLERKDTSAVTAAGRNEALLGLGSLATAAEAYRVADGQLAEFARVREEITAGHAPVDDTEESYLAYRPGDTITAPDSAGAPASVRVVGLTVTEDDETGRALITPTLGDMLIGAEPQLAQVTKKMAPGSVAGQSKVAQAATPAATPERT